MKVLHFTGDRLREICVTGKTTVRAAMKLMTESRIRLVPVIEASEMRLVGVLADGDIRRFLSVDGSVDDPVAKACNHAPKMRREPLDFVNARRELQAQKTEYLPITREDGVLTDMFVLWAVNTPLDTVAVIMAGGLGTRLAPHTDNCPKPLIDLGGQPILTRIIEHLRDQGISRFVLSVNYLGDMIVNRYGNGRSLGVEIEYLHEAKRLGTGGALSLIDADRLSEPFLCMNGDILSDVDVNALLEQHQHNGWYGTMVAKEYRYTVPYGVIRRSSKGEFEGSDEKPTLSFPINAGIYMLSKEVLGMIPKDEFFDMPTLFDQLSQVPGLAGTTLHTGRWIDIGSLDELERARHLFEQEVSR